MTQRERFEKAVEGRHPDSIPVVLPYFHLYLDQVIGGLTDGGLTWAHRMYGSAEEKASIFRFARDYFGLDWIAVGGVGTAINNRRMKLSTIDDALVVRDTVTGETTPVTPVKPAEPPIAERLVHSPDDKELAKLPPVMTPEEIDSTGALEPARLLSSEYGDTIEIVSGVSMPGNQNYFYLGIYDMMTALKLEPDLVHALVDHSVKMIVGLLTAMSRAGVRCVWLEDNFVAGDLISREDYETFFFRANAGIIETVRDLGMYSIYYLTGDVLSRIPHILDMQPDCLAFEESKKTFIIDPVEVRKRVGGELCLFGNVDVYADIELGDEREWRRSIGHQLDAAMPEGNFVLSAGSPVTPDTPPAKLRRFIDFARKMGNRQA
ncbi:MAG: hypothetical protein J7M24_04765 [Candidatus Latescibacteria bacterium]|nr:hypothetical protein [Candidatus Latescibacterota bacterium]